MISVIVPVYRAEAYLEHCLRSITEQTYRDLEILLVDDGSPDRCPAICEAWAQRDPRITVYHQHNSGGGQARNTALDAARGEYIAFVDSDDYLAPQMLEFLLGLMEDDIDLVECGYVTTSDDSARFDALEAPYHSGCCSGREAMREHILDRRFRQVIWNKLYRRQVIGEVRFPQGTAIDDEFWTYRVIANARKLKWSDKALYAYRQQPDSVMHSLSVEKRLQAVAAKAERHELIRSQMPELEGDSCCNLWRTCIYQGQLALRDLPGPACRPVFATMDSVLGRYPKVFPANFSRKERFWLGLAGKSLSSACRLRNRLGIGM